jgi:hypothetical protein
VNTRRKVLAGTISFLGARLLFTARAAEAPRTTATADGPRQPPPPAAAGSGFPARSNNYEPDDVRHYGVIANNLEVATQNTAALRALVSPRGTFRGTVRFPNTTGNDVYYLNDIIPFHDGIRIDLQGSTLHFSKRGERADTNSGFIFAIRDFTIENGAIVVDYQMGSGGTNAGNALTFGNRGTDSQYFSPTFDSMLAAPMGNITVRNLRITSNTVGGNGIFMIGGLNGVLMENVWIKGSAGALGAGIYYEFGWATNEPNAHQRQTSHAYNMRFVNINITDINTTSGQAFGLTGAYSCSIDGLYVKSSKILFQCSPGESAFYRPWKGVDEIGAKRNIALRNVVGVDIAGTALSITGASAATGGYLRKANLNIASQADLIDFSIDGFTIDGANLDGGYGIHSSAEKMDVRNGRITQFSRGIVTTDECTRMNIEGVDIIGCRQWGMEIGQGFPIWSPARQKMGFIRGCFVAGNGTATPGSFAAIEIDNCVSFFIEGNRLGYEPSHDGVAETTQGFGVRLGANAHNVVCRGNYIAGAHAGGFAYYSFSTGDTQGNTIENPSGLITTRGSWAGPSAKR